MIVEFLQTPRQQAVLESLEGLFSGLTSWSKLDETHSLCQNWAQKHQNCPKSIFRKSLVAESWLTTQNNCKYWFTMGILRYASPLDNQKCPKKCIFCVLYIILKVSISFLTKYIHQGQKGRKWEFQVFFEWDFQNFFQNLVDYNVHANQKESMENWLWHWGVSFHKNLNLAVSLRIIQF